MAPPHWAQTRKKIETELEGLFLNSPQQLTDLVSPQPVPDQIRPNILIRYPGFLNWLRDLAESHVPALMHNLKAPGRHRLKHEIALYQSRKRGYEKWVGDLLDTINGRLTGKAILGEIAAASKHTVSINPYVKKNKDDFNASETADDEAAATSVGMPLMDNEGKPIGGSGAGTGSDAEINFSPSMWGLFSDGRSAPDSKPSGPASNPDEVLCHELIHACRDLRGFSYRLGVNGGFDNEEEYLAVVIDNIYLSEKGQTQLRASHNGHTVLKDPDKFLDAKIDLRPRVLLERLRLGQFSLFHSLAQIEPRFAKFNPVWQYNQELKQGKSPPP